MQNAIVVPGRIMINLKQNDTKDASLLEVYPNGVPNNIGAVKDVAAEFFGLGIGALSDYEVRDDRMTSGNILIRPQAVFGQTDTPAL